VVVIAYLVDLPPWKAFANLVKDWLPYFQFAEYIQTVQVAFVLRYLVKILEVAIDENVLAAFP
jgi:hypothetical protein